VYVAAITFLFSTTLGRPEAVAKIPSFVHQIQQELADVPLAESCWWTTDTAQWSTSSMERRSV
jgi:hypothetical protein